MKVLFQKVVFSKFFKTRLEFHPFLKVASYLLTHGRSSPRSWLITRSAPRGRLVHVLGGQLLAPFVQCSRPHKTLYIFVTVYNSPIQNRKEGKKKPATTGSGAEGGETFKLKGLKAWVPRANPSSDNSPSTSKSCIRFACCCS